MSVGYVSLSYIQGRSAARDGVAACVVVHPFLGLGVRYCRAARCRHQGFGPRCATIPASTTTFSESTVKVVWLGFLTYDNISSKSSLLTFVTVQECIWVWMWVEAFWSKYSGVGVETVLNYSCTLLSDPCLTLGCSTNFVGGDWNNRPETEGIPVTRTLPPFHRRTHDGRWRGGKGKHANY